jgi:hypothetical protein
MDGESDDFLLVLSLGFPSFINQLNFYYLRSPVNADQGSYVRSSLTVGEENRVPDISSPLLTYSLFPVDFEAHEIFTFVF